MSNLKMGSALGSILGDIEKKYGESIFIGDLPEFELVPFTSPQLNYLTRGGIPYGASTEIVGEEHSGKTTLVLDLIKNYQEMEIKRVEREKERLLKKAEESKGKAKETYLKQAEELAERWTVYLDIEQTLNPQWMAKLGVDESKVAIYKPSAVGIEEPLDDIIKMLETGEVGFVAIDSVGQMISTAEQDNDLGKGNYGGISRSLTRYYKKAAPLYSKNKVAHVVVNQTRQDMAGYGQLIRPGGNAHKFAQSVVLRLRPGALLDEKYQTIPRHEASVYARETIVNLVKNKMTGSDRQTVTFTIRPNKGVDIIYDASLMAQELGIIAKGGAWYTVFDPRTGEELTKVQGIARVMEYLDENKEYTDNLLEYIYEEVTKDEI